MSKAKYHVPQPGEVIEFTSSANISYLHKTVEKWDSKHGYLTTTDGSRYLIKDRSSIKPAEPVKKPAPEKKDEEFKVGDRVAEIENFEGIRGTIKGFNRDTRFAAVDYDQSTLAFHACCGQTREHHGFWTKLEDIRHLTPEELAEEANAIPQTEPVKEEVRAEAGDGLRWVDSSAGEPVAVSTEFTVRLPTSFASEVERAKAIADAEAEEKKRSEKVIDEMNRLADEIVALTNKRRDVMAANEDEEEDHQLRVNYLRSLRVRGEK